MSEVKAEEFFSGGEMPIQHYAAVGRFIEAVSRVEIALHLKFRELLGLPENISRALIKEPGVARILDDMKLIVDQMDVQLSMTFKTNFERLATEIKEYNSIRAIIAHNPFKRTSTHFQFFNVLTAKDVERSITYECSIAQLHGGADELHIIALQIDHLPVGGNPIFPSAEIAMYIEEQRTATRDLPPWRNASNKTSIRQSREAFNKSVKYKHNRADKQR